MLFSSSILEFKKKIVDLLKTNSNVKLAVMYVISFISRDINNLHVSNAFTLKLVLKALPRLISRQKHAKRHFIISRVFFQINNHSIYFLQMLASTSYNGEALTSQPRSTRGCSTSSGMDLSYVTGRIISMWFPSSTNSHSYRQGQRQAAHMLRNKHDDNYMVSV